MVGEASALPLKADITRRAIEARVFAGLKERLMAPELVREFIRAFQEEANRPVAEREQQIKADRTELESVDAK